MLNLKKLFYGLIVFFIVLISAVGFAANSSFVIKKAADAFAPEYNISYDDISGNIFTGITVKGLKYDDKILSEKIKFSWNPSKLLYKRVVINALTIEGLDVNVTKALIDSFPSDDSSASEPLPVVIIVDEVHLDVAPFAEEGISFSKTVLDAKDIMYANDTLDIKDLTLQIDTNLTNISYEGNIKNNKLLGTILVQPKEALYKRYQLPIRKDAIGDISIDVDISETYVKADIQVNAKQVLLVDKENNSTDLNTSKAFNIDIDMLTSHVEYGIKDATLLAVSEMSISTPYAKNISITNKFIMDKNISYEGDVKSDKLIGIDAKMLRPLNNLNIQYSGDLKSIKADIASEGLKGSFVSLDFKKGHFHIETKKTIVLDKILELPGELNGTKVNAVIDIPLDFAQIVPIQARAKITSNITNLDVEVMYEEKLQAKITSILPKESLLKNFDEKIKWAAINPLVLDVELDENDAVIKLKSKELSAHVTYLLQSGTIDGTIKLAGLATDIRGVFDERLMIKTNISSMKALLSSIKSLYTVEDLPPLDGTLNASIEILKLEQINLSLSSPQIIYQSDHKTANSIDNFNLVISANKSQVQLKSYTLTYAEMKLFSTKPSIINMKDDVIDIAPLWINDQLKVVGKYNTKTRKGEIATDANKLHIVHEMIELDSAVNIKTVLDEDKTAITGKVILLGGKVHYDLSTKSYPSDSDIIIVQDITQDGTSPFMDNLSMNIDVTTKEPLIYKEGPIDIKANAHVSIHKAEQADILVLGEVTLLKDGSYTFEGKKFVLDESKIYFTGNPNKPILDIRVKYKSLNHLITIGISGTPTAPNIIFSSIPSLKKEQILSIILFDSEDGAGTNSGDDMMKMMGGAMAKSALADMGIKLDHLAIGADGSVEVGKKLTDKITFIYVNDDIPQVRVKYQHNSRVDSVISTDEISQAYDIVYKRDFKTDEISIFKNKD